MIVSKFHTPIKRFQRTRALASQRASTPDSMKGRISLVFPFDIGDSVDLQACRKILSNASDLTSMQTSRAPRNYGFDPPPLVVTKTGQPLRILDQRVETQHQALVYDFGAISVTLTFDFSGTLETFRQLAILLDEEVDGTCGHQRAITTFAQSIFSTIRPAIRQPDFNVDSGRYRIFQIYQPPAKDPEDWYQAERASFAQILEATEANLSDQQINHTASHRISYARDLAIIGDDSDDHGLRILPVLGIEHHAQTAAAN